MNSVFSAMEIGLKMHAFNVTEDIVYRSVKESTKNFDFNDENQNVIKSVSRYDCKFSILF
jgi:hypothetical protein